MLCRLRRQTEWIVMPVTNAATDRRAGKHCTETRLRPSHVRLTKSKREAVLARENSISFRLATVFACRRECESSARERISFTAPSTIARFVIFEAHFKRNYIHIRDVVRPSCMAWRILRR